MFKPPYMSLQPFGNLNYMSLNIFKKELKLQINFTFGNNSFRSALFTLLTQVFGPKSSKVRCALSLSLTTVTGILKL